MHFVKPELNKALKDVFGINAPTKEGVDVVRGVMAMHEEKAKVFIALGGNFLSAVSDTYYCAEAFEKCALTVNISTKLNRTHLVTGKVSLVLPTLGRSEKDTKGGKNRQVTVENSMGKVHTSSGHLTPASDQLMSEPEIVANIANSTLKNSPVEWLKLGKDYTLVREKISQVIAGFNNYSERAQDGGFYLPNNARQGDFSKLPGGRAQFSVCPLPDHKLAHDEYLLTTIRSHDQFNTTIYGLDDRYRGVLGERRVLFISQVDMDKIGIKKLELVDLESHYDGKVRSVQKFHAVPYDIPQGNLAGYFPEMNPLVPISLYADESYTPVSKSVKVKVVKRKE